MARKMTQGAAAIAYYRVSTREQGDSRLGLDAQRRAVDAFCEGHGFRVIESFEDIESGKHNDRPGLAAAMKAAAARRAKLLIARLDRLSRDVEFIFHLRNTGVDFVAVDLPEANTLTISIMAAMAQHERELISSRTKAALAELKARGKRLGCRPGHSNLTDEGRRKAAATKLRRAVEAANGAMHHATAYRRDGWTLAAIAEQLNRSGLRTRHGLPHSIRSVRALVHLAERAGLSPVEAKP